MANDLRVLNELCYRTKFSLLSSLCVPRRERSDYCPVVEAVALSSAVQSLPVSIIFFSHTALLFTIECPQAVSYRKNGVLSQDSVGTVLSVSSRGAENVTSSHDNGSNLLPRINTAPVSNRLPPIRDLNLRPEVSAPRMNPSYASQSYSAMIGRLFTSKATHDSCQFPQDTERVPTSASGYTACASYQGRRGQSLQRYDLLVYA